MRDALGSSSVGLIDVYTLDGAAEGDFLLSFAFLLSGRFATDGVVEDEDFGRPGSNFRQIFVFGFV